MEIRFSAGLWKPKLLGAPHYEIVNDVAEELGVGVSLTSDSGRFVRFTLPGASVADHDRVIRALLTLDPDATVRTARAVYEGLEDFEKQRGK